MSNQELEKKSGCSKRVVLFFVFAVAIVAAFLIIGLVRTCEADHDADQAPQMEQIGSIPE